MDENFRVTPELMAEICKFIRLQRRMKEHHRIAAELAASLSESARSLIKDLPGIRPIICRIDGEAMVVRLREDAGSASPLWLDVEIDEAIIALPSQSEKTTLLLEPEK